MNHIIYHQVKEGVDCPDGIMAATIAARFFRSQNQAHCLMGDSYRHAADYGEIPDRQFSEGDRVVIVDFSYPAHWLRHWESQGVIVTVIDHHAPKFPMLEGFANAVLDANECGATLTWKYFFPDEPIPELLKHVRRRDIGADGYYDGLIPDSEAINEGLSKYRFDRKDLPDITRDLETLFVESQPSICQQLLELGQPEIEKRDRIVNAVCDRAVFREIAGYRVPFVQTEAAEDRYASQIGNTLCKRFFQYPFAWILLSDGESNSLRSAASGINFDVSEIASQFGGGGHRNAAGFRSKKN